MSSVITTPRTRRIAILQSNYIPWKGYFDIIRSVDDFVIHDTLQYTKGDWRNRNRIKTPNGLQWLTIPVEYKRVEQTINATKTANGNWAQKHWRLFCHHYSKAAYFKEYKDLFGELYLGDHSNYLSEINLKFIHAINTVLGITTRLHWSSDLKIVEGKTERLVEICKQLGAMEYLTGPSAKDYIDESLFQQENIALVWADYNDYPQYRQLHPPFEHTVTVLDLIFNEGPNARRYTKRF
jgi:hypothetical protein